MEIGNLIPHIEALVFASDRPLTAMDITELINNAFGFMDDKINMEQIQTAIDGVVEKYQSEVYPFEMRESGGGWQFLTKKEYHKTVAQLNGEKFLKRLSTAALETLAIIAYKQPITKSDVESIRGVNCDYSIQKLLEKELIVITGRNEELPGKPLIYTTSRSFMDYFGINSPADLPKLKEVFADAILPTSMAEPMEAQEEAPEVDTDEASPMMVTEDGELLETPAEEYSEQKSSFEGDGSHESQDDADNEVTEDQQDQPSDDVSTDNDDDQDNPEDDNPEEKKSDS